MLEFSEHDNRVSLFYGAKKGSIRNSSSYSPFEVYEKKNVRAINGLPDWVNLFWKE